MKISSLVGLICGVLVVQIGKAAEHKEWAGEYTDKQFLNGSATFQFSVEQSGKTIQVSFDAVNNNGQGCAPEAQGVAKETAKGALEFTFQDNNGNAGKGSAVRNGDGVVVSLTPTRVSKKDCVAFYRPNIRLKRVSK